MALIDGNDYGEVPAERREYPDAQDALPRMEDGTLDGRRVMTSQIVLERERLNAQVTSTALTERAKRAAARNNGRVDLEGKS